MLKLALAFGAGFAAGLWFAKQYAKSEVHSEVHDLLGKVGLSGGQIEELAQGFIDSKVFNE